MVANKKELILDGLNCASCALKIEDKVKSLPEVTEVKLNFSMKKLVLETDKVENIDGIINNVRAIVKKLEPDVVVREKKILFNQKKAFLLMGLDCANCANKIEKEVMGIPEVKSAGLNFAAKKLMVEADAEASNPEILEKVRSKVDGIEPGVKVKEINPRVDGRISKEEKQGEKLEAYRLIVGAVLFAVALIFKFAFSVEVLLYVTSYVLVGGEVLIKSAKNILRGQVFDENFLMAVATIGAFAIRQFPEAVAVMLFYQVGELFQDHAVNRSRKSIADLMDIRPDHANLKIGDQTKQVGPETVKIGEKILVKPGEKFPLDGEIVDGKSMVDTSAMTGESVPRKAVPGAEVLAGFINKSGVLTVKVTKEFSQSTVSKILDLVENAAGKKAPTENFITKFARYYTPAVVFGALAIALIPPLLIEGATFRDWIYRALVMLVISCPCALVVSIPLGFFGGIGGASRNGILIKGGNYLEALNNVKIVVFDKTGTLTKGVFKVTKIMPRKNFTDDKLLEYAALAEAHSNHPIAKSIKEAYSKEVDSKRIEEYEEITGHGIKIKARGKEILAGNIKLMKKEGVDCPENKVIGTVVHLAVDKKYAGYIVISDEMKDDAIKTMKKLKQIGVEKLVMLTGDNKRIADQLGEVLGIDHVHAELLPDQKVGKVEGLNKKKKQNDKLLFVGDGINDAPVLARADVGVAMGGLGSDAAIEAADVVLMTDEPSKLSSAIRIAKRTRGIVWQNIILALAVKGVFLAMGAVGIATMWEAVFADVGVALLAILNSMRVLKLKIA